MRNASALFMASSSCAVGVAGCMAIFCAIPVDSEEPAAAQRQGSVQSMAASILGQELKPVFAPAREISHDGQGLTAVEKIFNKNMVGVKEGTVLHAGSDVRVNVNIVGSQDTTGLMTSQELEAMAATIISPTVDGAYQSGCHTASVWDKELLSPL